MPDGELTAERAAAVLGALLPDGAIVSDEANTSGLWLPGATAGAPPHDWLTLTGGAIGQGLPLATGAAIACPDRPVLALEADGSAMYTISALWTHAREQLDITTVIFSNRCYAILGMELDRVGATAAAAPGPAGRPGTCSSCPGRTLTSPRWPPGWACPPAGPGPRRSSPPRCGTPWPSPARTSSRRSSPRSARDGLTGPGQQLFRPLPGPARGQPDVVDRLVALAGEQELARSRQRGDPVEDGLQGRRCRSPAGFASTMSTTSPLAGSMPAR